MYVNIHSEGAKHTFVQKKRVDGGAKQIENYLLYFNGLKEKM